MNWTSELRLLKRWYWAYLVSWLSGMSLFIASLGKDADPNHLGTWGLAILAVALISYILCLVFAYKVQKKLHEAGLIKHPPAHIILAGILFNPCLVGFWVPLSVLLAERKARKTLLTHGQTNENGNG